MMTAGQRTPSRISASRIPPFLRVRRAASRSEVNVKGRAIRKPTALPMAMRPEFVWGFVKTITRWRRLREPLQLPNCREVLRS